MKNTSLISICRYVFLAETTKHSFVLRFRRAERPETGHPKVPEFLLGEFWERIFFFFASSEMIPVTETGCSAGLRNWTDNSSSLSHCTVVCWFTSSAGCDGIHLVGAGKKSGCDDKNSICRWSSDKDEVRKALVSLLLSIQKTLRNLTMDVFISFVGRKGSTQCLCLSIVTWQSTEMLGAKLPLVLFPTFSTQQVLLPLSRSRDSEDWSPFFCSVVLLHSQ